MQPQFCGTAVAVVFFSIEIGLSGVVIQKAKESKAQKVMLISMKNQKKRSLKKMPANPHRLVTDCRFGHP